MATLHNPYLLTLHQILPRMLRSVRKCLCPFRGVNVHKTRLHPVAISQHRDSVAIGDTHHRGMDRKVLAGTEPVRPPIVTQPGCCLTGAWMQGAAA
jgi:hypothetical protein